MFIDAATLDDLEVLSTATTHGPTVWNLVNRTRTRAGRDRLRHQLVANGHSTSSREILALQRAHQLLATEANVYREGLDIADTDGIERYLGSNWQLPAAMRRLGRMGGGLWRGAWYRQYLQDVASGQVRVHSLLAAAAELGRRLSATDAAVLQDLGARIAALLSRPAALELTRLATRSTSTARLAFDQLARDEAKPLLSDVVECVGTLEAMWSLAVATVEHSWSYPRPSSHLNARGLFHPFLGDKAVPNDLHLDERVRVCFITGPNMAGKSTFLKAIALAILLGHAGCGVPAASLDFPVVGAVFSSVQIADSLSAGESFYLAEVRRIRALAVALYDHKSAVAVVDEPFRGTNVHDATEATLAVITRLADHPASLVFVASHIGEVAPSIMDDSRICLLHFAADVTADRPRFDYRLRAGVSAQRLGMTLLRQERVLELLERSVRS